MKTGFYYWSDMNIKKEQIKQWSDEKAREYLDEQNPNDEVEWIVLDESLYGFTDSAGALYAYADDDEHRIAGIIQFLLRNGGSYISNG